MTPAVPTTGGSYPDSTKKHMIRTDEAVHQIGAGIGLENADLLRLAAGKIEQETMLINDRGCFLKAACSIQDRFATRCPLTGGNTLSFVSRCNHAGLAR